MIFVSVGTHPQQFDRLIAMIDALKRDDVIREEVFIQRGCSLYRPTACKFEDLLAYDVMVEYVRKCSIYISHGGPGNIFLGLQNDKIPIVVPRMKEYGEHVDNHQVDFVKRLEFEKRILAVYSDMTNIKDKILNYERLISTLHKPIAENVGLQRLVENLISYTNQIAK